MLTNFLRRAQKPASDLLFRERPNLDKSATPLEPERRTDADALDEYAQLTAAVGISHAYIGADLKVERFKLFLRQKDWAVFDLGAVAAYMDEKAAIESTDGAGWHWRPLRETDHIKNARFGRPAHHNRHSGDLSPSSDHYEGPSRGRAQNWANSGALEVTDLAPSAGTYDKLVPLHALRKVAQTQAEFPEPVAFFVCDYAPAPLIQHPDPFLMAVIDNARLHQGVGRFVIDFWDEPGFGLDAQLTG